MLLKELNDTTDVDTPDLAAKGGDFIPLKVEVAKKVLINWLMIQLVWII